MARRPRPRPDAGGGHRHRPQPAVLPGRHDITQAALLQISAIVPDAAWAQWAARLAPTAAIEAIIAWLDAGQPDPGLAADRVRHVIAGVISAAAAHAGYDYLPPPTV